MSHIASPAQDPGAVRPRAALRRLRTYFRSAGWPCQDGLEFELLTAGLVERWLATDAALERIVVTGAGLRAMDQAHERNRQCFDAHESLVASVATFQARAGRLVYRGLSLRAPLDRGWKLCSPHLYSLRYRSVAAYTEPVIHEIKVRRADLFSDLRNPGKRAAYQALSATFYYVMPAGLARLDEIPEDCGVLYAQAEGFALGRSSPPRAVEPAHAVWMALARRAAEPVDLDEVQAWLDDPTPAPPP